MSSLTGYITEILDQHRDHSESMRKKLSAMRSALASYLGQGCDAGLESLVDAEFLLGFGRYLFGGAYAGDQISRSRRGHYNNLAPQTLTSHLARLRSVLHEAIAAGKIPAIDPFPAVSLRLQDEFNLSDEAMRPVLGNDSNRFMRLTTFSFGNEIEKLTTRLLGDTRSKVSLRKSYPVLIYLMGIYAFGMEPEDLLAIRWDSDSESAVDDSVSTYHPRLGRTVQLPERALRIADLLNKGYEKDGYLIRRRPAWQGLDATEIARQVTEAMQILFRNSEISLMNGGDIRSDWVCLMKESGLSDTATQSLLSGNVSTEEMTEILKRAETILPNHSMFRKRWHILCSYDRKLDGAKMKGIVANLLKDKGIRFDRNRESYDPRNIEKRIVRGRVVKRNNPLISRYLFLYCTAEVAKRIDSQISEASFLRSLSDRSRYATVSHREVLAMVNFLNDFREEVQFVDASTRPTGDQFAEGVRVRILTGPFAGFEGTISQVIGKCKETEDNRQYQVEVDGFAMSINAKIRMRGLELDHAPQY